MDGNGNTDTMLIGAFSDNINKKLKYRQHTERYPLAVPGARKKQIFMSAGRNSGLKEGDSESDGLYNRQLLCSGSEAFCRFGGRNSRVDFEVPIE